MEFESFIYSEHVEKHDPKKGITRINKKLQYYLGEKTLRSKRSLI